MFSLWYYKSKFGIVGRAARLDSRYDHTRVPVSSTIARRRMDCDSDSELKCEILSFSSNYFRLWRYKIIVFCCPVLLLRFHLRWAASESFTNLSTDNRYMLWPVDVFSIRSLTHRIIIAWKSNHVCIIIGDSWETTISYRRRGDYYQVLYRNFLQSKQSHFRSQLLFKIFTYTFFQSFVTFW